MKASRGHRRQHFVPQCYLQAWCDPAKPKWQDPYVWRFNADGSNPRQRAPKNIFHETDLYTIKGEGGERDLRLEHGLKDLEDAFVSIRDRRFERSKLLAPLEHFMICAFVAAAHARTPSYSEFVGGQWRSMLQKMDR